MTSQLQLPELQLAQKEEKIAIAAALAAAVLFGFIPILVRICASYLSPNATIFNRFWIVTAILGFWNVLRLPNRQTNLSVKNLPKFQELLVPLLGLVISFLSCQLSWTWSLTQTTVANSEVLHSLTPGFITLATWMLFGQKFGGRFLIGVTVAMVGAIAIGASDFSSSINLEGDGLALLSAIFWGGYIISAEQLCSWLNPAGILMWASGSVAILFFPLLLLAGDEILPHSGGAWLALITLALNTIACFCLVNYCLIRLASGLVATILLLSPILTAVLGWVLFSEALSPLNLLGFVVILAGIYLAISDKEGLKAVEE